MSHVPDHDQKLYRTRLLLVVSCPFPLICSVNLSCKRYEDESLVSYYQAHLLIINIAI